MTRYFVWTLALFNGLIGLTRFFAFNPKGSA